MVKDGSRRRSWSASSSPTDRDGCSPLLPESNGRGRLFAAAFVEPVLHLCVRTSGRPARTASPGNGYNEPGTHLDAESLETILAWLRGTIDLTESQD